MDKLAVKYGKHDIERLGLFVEMPYLSAQLKKVPKKNKAAIGSSDKTMLAGGPKIKCGNMDGYFGKEFIRVFGGESRKKKDKTKPVVIKTPFIPTGPSKLHSCPGDYFGSFSGNIKAMSPKQRRNMKKGKGKEATKPNPMTNPGKKGGPGYINITIGPYPPHSSVREKKKKVIRTGVGTGKPALITMIWPKPYFYPNPFIDEKKGPPTKPLYNPPEPKIDKKWLEKPTFIPVGPAKDQGGCHAGCFDRWPEHKPEKYLSPAQIEKFVGKKKQDKKKATAVATKPTFIPAFTALKTMFTGPTLANTDFTMNETNWKVYKPNFVKYLV